ncbi:MAG: type II secretion system F family protein [Aestuariivirga sp.]|uniref:type II secretion system F family protein n=1 Tax=Aestuariivirga sp. TaxID=2650926 RepID=UPI0038D00D58
MLDTLPDLAASELLIALLLGVAAFGMVMGLAGAAAGGDPLAARVRAIAEGRANSGPRRGGQGRGAEVRLRETQNAGLAARLVDALKLRQVFEVEPSRGMLRQAGYRSERHLVVLLMARFLTPIAAGFLVYAYSAAILASAMPAQMRIAVTVAGILTGYYLPVLVLKNMVARRQASISRAWPDALDLMLICVEAGMAVEPAMQRVAREIGSISEPLEDEMSLTVAELAYLQERRKAFENLAKRTGLPIVKAVVTTLIQSERYGTPLGLAFRVLAQENRETRMAEAERKAAALAPKLTVPMMLFFMPALFVVILGPVGFKVMETLAK